MESSEKEIIPLSDLPPKHDSESIADKPSTSGATDLVPAKFPSRPRRKVVILVVVIAVVVFVIIAATLMGKYIPEYLGNANSKSKQESGDPEGTTSTGIPSYSKAATTKPSLIATSADYQQGKTFSLPNAATLSTNAVKASDSAIMPSSWSSITSESSKATHMSIIANLVLNTESKWSRWSSWNDCSKTCGIGSRYRNRTCLAINPRSVFAPITCAGKPDQIKPCAEWSCPDCSRNCTIGTLNTACDACTCDHHVLTGRVLTVNDAPLSEVNISLAETPYRILAQTNVSGYFTAPGVCADVQELLVTKIGFVPVTQRANVLTSTTATIIAKMEFAVPPFVTVHPESKIRMPGQSVTFCCEGQGNPPPEIECYNNNLEIVADHGLNGSYRCRAVNNFGSEFSDTATLTIVGLDVDSCPSAPKSKIVTLPEGCVENATGGNLLDVGECEPVACLKNDSLFNSSCQDPTFCCGPGDTISVLVDCRGILSFDISKVISCSCGSCSQTATNLQGIVVGGPEEEPMRYGDVIYDNKIVTYTDEDGKFSFEIPRKVNRVAVTFKDSYYKEFEERTKVFLFNEGSTGFYKITLKRTPSPVSFNASEPLEIPLRNDPNIESFADLELPEESFLSEDGSLFQGNAKAIVSVTDSRNLSDVISAPGDFTTTDEEGEEEILETFGMMKMKFEDDNGKQLALSKPMKVYLDPERLNISVPNGPSVPMKLYWLDKKTQRWREAGDFKIEDGNKRRRKRSNRVFFVGTITPVLAQATDLNFDWPHVRVGLRVTTDPPRAGVIVRVIRKEEGAYRGFTEKTTTSSGSTCIPIWRNKQCVLQAESGGRYLMPVQSSVNNLPNYTEARVGQKTDENTRATIWWISFKSILYENSVERTPMYKVNVSTEQNACQSPQYLEGSSQFTFRDAATSTDNSSILDTTKSWIPGGCYIKVKIYGENAIFAAESYQENKLNEKGRSGLHLLMSRNISAGDTKIACLQISCPSKNQFTYVKIAPLTQTCIFRNVHEGLKYVQYPECPKDFTRPVCAAPPPARQGQAKWVWIPVSGNGQTIYKIFRGEGRLGKYGEARCLEGQQSVQHSKANTITDGGEALEYDCRLNDDGFKSTVRAYNWPSNGDKCFVKIKVTGRRAMFRAESYAPNKRDLYGNSTDVTRPTLQYGEPDVSVACLEFRCSDVLSNGSLINNTYIVVRPISNDCKFVKLGRKFNFYQSQCPYSMPPQQGEVRSLCDVPIPYGSDPSPGLYNNRILSTPESSCRVGYLGSGITPSGTYSKGYALHFQCS
ncbi:cartilage intermediate layer protein 1-like [Stylophora pistillata]|uniref:cartilage intermediate layer protein 1-like n=1 Tax=Stylophora pistillata TaxID=50429 RepID=UPI000C050CCC|nr:cartilage intermediate layer protein 1-like [Stylophora pistillata]